MKQFDEVRLDSQFARTLRIWNGGDTKCRGKTSKSEKFESTGQCCQGETGQHGSFSSEELEVSPGCRQRLLPDIRQRFSTACHSVSPCDQR